MSSLALKDSIKECLSQEINGDEMNGELDLEGIDDAELDELILKEDEVKIKTLGWMRENADFLKESREKELRKARELLLNPKVNKVNRKPRQARPRMEFNSAQEALKQILKEKNLKDKVNYDILANFGLSPTKRKFEPCIEIQVADENRSTERCQSPAEKKAKIDLPQDLSGVQKQEAESDDEQYYYDKDEQENQPNQQQEFEYEEPCEEFDNYYSDSD